MQKVSADVDTRSDPFSAALAWLEAVVLGPVAMTTAVIAVAAMGYLMMTGRLNVSRAAQVILGCFIVFGAATIANGMLDMISPATGDTYVAEAAGPPTAVPSPAAHPTGSSSSVDPYSGATVPHR